MTRSAIYFLSFDTFPLKAQCNVELCENGLAKVWVKALGPDEALILAETYLHEYGFKPRHLVKAPVKILAQHYFDRPVELANFRKAEDFGIALHLEAPQTDSLL